MIEGEFEPERSSYVFRLYVVEPPPLRWGVVVGEIVHNLRSALDHLVWQLIRLNGCRPRGNPTYPTLKTEPADFRLAVLGTAAKPGPLRGVRDDALAIIERTQPYHGGGNFVLSALNTIWSADKHRFLVPTHVTVTTAALLAHHYVPNADAGPTMRIQPGTRNGPREAELVVIGLDPTGPDPQVEMQGEPPFDIAFGGGYAVVGLLNNIAGFVLTDVLSPLQDLFP